jgi:hypothetical protein
MVRRYSSSEPQKERLFRLNQSIEASLDEAVNTANVSANFLVNSAVAHYLAAPELWPKPDENLDDALQEVIKKLGGS